MSNRESPKKNKTGGIYLGKIVVLDDDVQFALSLSQKLKKHFKEEIEVLNAVDIDYLNSIEIDLIFIDIEMPGLNGIDLIKVLKMHNSKIKYVFITNHSNLVHEALEIGFLHFIHKPNLEQGLEVVYNLLDNLKFRSTSIIKLNDKYIDLNNIYYISANNHYIIVSEKTKKTRIRISINEVDELLQKHDFIRIHRSHIVNKNKIDAFDKNDVVLKNGEVLSVSRSCADVFKKSWDMSV